jgi:pimeloyl-ACP methyl ester carboxylesterase
VVVVCTAVAGLMVVVGCSGEQNSGGAAGTSTTSANQEPEVAAATYAEGPCPAGVTATPPVTVTCGVLTVPERHDRPDGPDVRLPVATLRPPTPTADDPVLVIDGGPGGDGVGLARIISEQPAAATRTAVIIGQRGTPLADPSFDCPETEAADRAAYPSDLGTEEQLDAYEVALRSCFERVSAEEPSFQAYDTATAADDLEAARRALGYDRWNLYGTSYGTRLALEVLRRHPGPVRSAVLDSVYPAEVESYATLAPAAERAFTELADACAADPGCAAAYPDLLGRIAVLYDRLEAEPVDVTVPHPGTGAPTTVRWDGDRTVQAAFNGLYYAEIIRLLPFLLRSFEQGDFSLATTTYLDLIETGSASLAEGLYYAVECRERAPFADEAGLRDQATTMPAWVRSAGLAETDLEDCESWVAPPADASTGEPVRSDVPTLVLAGRFDPITPPDWSRQVADTLENTVYVEFPGSGHAPGTDPCGGDVIAAFLDRPGEDPAPPCRDALGPPAWVLPS